jgi:outer membrane immunogenic protein
MKTALIGAVVATAFAGALTPINPAKAATLEDVLARLESLEKENATLRQRVKNLESNRSASRTTATRSDDNIVTGSVGPKSEARPAGGYYKAAPVVPVRCANFNGWYVGGNAGGLYYKSGLEDRNNFVSFPFAIGGTSTYSGTDSAFAGGPQGGYNYQRNCTVMGVEADWSWTDAKVNSVAHPNFLGAPTAAGTVDGKLRSFGTLRTRAGIVVDQLFLYVTGGLAWMDAKHTVSNVFPGLATEQFTFSDSRWGAVGGVGVEYAWSDNISIKSEVLYIATPDKTHSVQTNPVINRCVTNGSVCAFKTDDSAFVARIGINIRN